MQKLTKPLKVKINVFLSMTDKQTDNAMYILMRICHGNLHYKFQLSICHGSQKNHITPTEFQTD